MYATDPVWEGPTAALRRYYRDGPTAEFRSDVLLESTFSQGVPSSRTIVGVEFGQPGQVAAALCHGVCYGNPEPITISRSDDGGVTWRDQLELESGGSGSLIDLDGPTLIIRRLTAADTWSFIRVSPSGRDVLPLPAGVPLTAARLRNSGGVAGAAVFSEDRRTVWDLETARALVVIPADWRIDSLSGLQVLRSGQRTVELFINGPPAAGDEGYVAFFAAGTSEPTDVYRWSSDAHVTDVRVMGWISETLALGTASFDEADYFPETASFYHSIPALIDLEDGTVSPIQEFLPQLTAKAGGPVPWMVMTGAFARISTPGDCLNVRTTPSRSGAPLGCFVDGVLLGLRHVPEGQPMWYSVSNSEGAWFAVTTPDGREGWAAGPFLSVIPFPA